MYHDQSGRDCFLCRGTFSQLMQLIVNTIQYHLLTPNSNGSPRFQAPGPSLKLEPLLLQDKDIPEVSVQSYNLSTVILIVRYCMV